MAFHTTYRPNSLPFHSHSPQAAHSTAMGLSSLHALPSFSKLPTSLSSPHPPLLLLNPSLPLTLSHTTPIALTAPLSRSISLRNVVPRASTSEETSSGTSSFFDENRDGAAVVVEDVKPDDRSSFSESDVETQKVLPVEEQGPSLDFLDKLDIKFDTDDTGSIALYGGAAIVALWLTSAVVGAIESIPLFPKLLEIVGLGYTVWFTSRYLLFKQNRDELFAKIDELKEQVIGSGDK